MSSHTDVLLHVFFLYFVLYLEIIRTTTTNVELNRRKLTTNIYLHILCCTFFYFKERKISGMKIKMVIKYKRKLAHTGGNTQK